MGLFAPKQSATEKHFGIVPMDELQRLERQTWGNHGREVQDIANGLNAVLFDVANRLPADTLRVKFDGAFNEVDFEQKRMLILLGALERVQREGLNGPGRQEPFDEGNSSLAVQSLAHASDIRRLSKPILPKEWVEMLMKRRLDKALANLAARVSMRGKDKKNGNDWTCFTEEDRQALLATYALTDALEKGERSFVARHFGKGIFATTLAAGLAGGFAVTHTYPEETDAVRAAINEAVEPKIRAISPEAADLYERYNLIPTEPQAEQWLRHNLPQLADLVVGTPEEAPQE